MNPEYKILYLFIKSTAFLQIKWTLYLLSFFFALVFRIVIPSFGFRNSVFIKAKPSCNMKVEWKPGWKRNLAHLIPCGYSRPGTEVASTYL